MLREFLEDCNCVISDENMDFQIVKRRIGKAQPFVVFQPIITYEIAPIHILENTDAKKLVRTNSGEHVYIMPIGAHDFWIKKELEKLLFDFYFYDELPDKIGSGSVELSVNEMILLHNPKISHHFELREWSATNIVYMSANVCTGPSVHILLICDKPENAWNLLSGQYSVSTDILVDSHKGFGTHFALTSLFESMQKEKDTTCLPKIVLEGLYASECFPDEFEVVHSEMLEGNNYEFYFTPWGKENDAYAVLVENVVRAEADRKRKYEDYSSIVREYLNSTEGLPPLKEIKWLVECMMEKIKKDGGVSDFSDIDNSSSYMTINNKWSDELLNRAELFFYLASWFVFEEDYRESKKAKAMLSEMIEYHITRARMNKLHRNSYRFLLGDENLKAFAKAINEYVKMLQKYDKFKNFMNEGRNPELFKCM